ncbi:MAG: hypothetical protein ACI4IA_07845 [Acutalibacteraceae bacterium]
MKDRQKRKLRRTTMLLGGASAAAAGTALGIYAAWPQIKEFFLKKLEEHNDRVRPALQVAKDRKAAIAAEQKKLKKDMKKLDKKVKKARQQQATRVYNEYLAKGYEPTADMIHEAALSDLDVRAEVDAKKAERQAETDARVEEAVQKKQTEREEKAAARYEEQHIRLKDGKEIAVSSTVRPEDVAK